MPSIHIRHTEASIASSERGRAIADELLFARLELARRRGGRGATGSLVERRGLDRLLADLDTGDRCPSIETAHVHPGCDRSAPASRSASTRIAHNAAVPSSI